MTNQQNQGNQPTSDNKYQHSLFMAPRIVDAVVHFADEARTIAVELRRYNLYARHTGVEQLLTTIFANEIIQCRWYTELLERIPGSIRVTLDSNIKVLLNDRLHDCVLTEIFFPKTEEYRAQIVLSLDEGVFVSDTDVSFMDCLADLKEEHDQLRDAKLVTCHDCHFSAIADPLVADERYELRCLRDCSEEEVLQVNKLGKFQPWDLWSKGQRYVDALHTCPMWRLKERHRPI